MTDAERIARLEVALAETLYSLHGEHGLPSLRRQAPHAAQLLADYIVVTEAVDDAHFVGRKLPEPELEEA